MIYYSYDLLQYTYYDIYRTCSSKSSSLMTESTAQGGGLVEKQYMSALQCFKLC